MDPKGNDGNDGSAGGARGAAARGGGPQGPTAPIGDAGKILALAEELGTLERDLGPDHPSTLAAVDRMAATARRMGNPAGARDLFERSLAARERTVGPDHADTLDSLLGLAGALTELGERGRAQEAYARVYVAAGGADGPPSVRGAYAELGLAHEARVTGRRAQAEALYRRGARTFESLLGPDHPDSIAAKVSLGVVCLETGNSQLAFESFAAAVEPARRTYHPLHEVTVEAVMGFAESSVRLGHPMQAMETLLRTLTHPQAARLDGPTRNKLELMAAKLRKAAEGMPRGPGRHS